MAALPTAAATAFLNNTPQATENKLPKFNFNKNGTIRDSIKDLSKCETLRNPTSLSPTTLDGAGSEARKMTIQPLVSFAGKIFAP